MEGWSMSAPQEDALQVTPLAACHRRLGARMVPFAGWEMPVQYPEGILAEHHHTRRQASLFDICHMGEFRVLGEGVAAALDRIFPRPVLDQPVGACRYNFLLTETGTVIDDLIVYRLAENEFYIVVNAGNRADDAACLRQRLPSGIAFHDESAATAKLDLQGPESAAVLARVGLPAAALPGYYRWRQVAIAGVPVLLSRTGYTGELGFELYFPATEAEHLWTRLLAVDPVKPAGLGARDTLRLEVGYPLHGHEMDTDTTPVEAGFGALIPLADLSRDFHGAKALRNSPPRRRLVGIEFAGRRAARAGAPVLQADRAIGKICSGTFSPSLEKAIALAYIDAASVPPPGAEVTSEAGRQRLPGRIVETPFYRGGTVRQKLSAS
jgi:aminomethyltransferase